MSYVSDEAVEKVASELTLTRQQRRELQRMDSKQLRRWMTNIYRQGFEDGAEAIDKAVRQEAEAKHADPEQEYEEVKADWDDVLRLIAEVKGVGPKLTEAIDRKLKEAMG